MKALFRATRRVSRQCVRASRRMSFSTGPAGSAFEGKRVVVTGSTSGIGAAVARRFAQGGARVVINGFGQQQDIDRLVSELVESGAPQVEYNAADLSSTDGPTALVEDAAAALGGPIHILVNNAGIQYTSPVEEFPIEQWNRVIAINLTAVFAATRAAIPQMTENGFERVINVASVHGLVGSTNKSAYVAAKHGVMGLTKVTGLEMASSQPGRLTCNAVCPGWVKTDLVEKQIQDRADKAGTSFEAETQALLSEKQPSQIFVQPEHLADAVAFLASDSAANMNGSSIVMDGGWTSQ